MGSFVYASRSRKRNEHIVAMLALETIGYYSDEPGSQSYPFPLSSFYPSTGNFIGLVGNTRSRRLVERTAALFRKHSDVPVESIAAPGAVPGIGWSDHWSFWQFGYPALMITDTAPFRYRHYHTPEDTPEKIDYMTMSRVTNGVAAVVEELAGGGPS